MFEQKVRRVVRKLDIPEKVQKEINLCFGQLKCCRKLGRDLNYYELYNLKGTTWVYQDGDWTGVCKMDPFKNAVVISGYKANTIRIHKFYPNAFSQSLVLKEKEDIEKILTSTMSSWPMVQRSPVLRN